MPSYSFSKCLENAYKVSWRIEDVLDGPSFDPSTSWLPASLSARSRLDGFDEDELRKLTHVEMAAYAHLFAYAEEFIAPKVSSLAADHAVENRVAFDALTNFAAEEVKHMNLFRQLRDEVNATLGFDLGLAGGQAETARLVLKKSTAAVMLLTSCIEWFTQRHYLEAFKEDGGLDSRTKKVFRAHWQEESQHAQLDHLETVRAFATLTEEERETAIDELIELVGVIDGLLQTQVQHDLANFERYVDRKCSPSESERLVRALSDAKRWTFILSGVTHPRFEHLMEEVTTPQQRERIGVALEGLMGAMPSSA